MNQEIRKSGKEKQAECFFLRRFVPKKRWRLSALLLPLSMFNLLFNTACSAPRVEASGDTPVYVVTATQTPFYKNGPAQAVGADLSLKKGEMLTLLERHYGYSRVQTGDGQTGYVATDDIAPAPPETPKASVAARLKKTGGFGSAAGSVRAPDFEQQNDAALPSTQPSSDTPVPSFRY